MKTFVKYITPFLIVLQSVLAIGQTDTSTISMSLDKAIDLGMNQRFDIKNQELAVQISKSNLEATQSKNLPQITASADMRYNGRLATNILPAGAFGPEPQAVRFGTTYNTLVSLNATQNLYNAGVSGDKLVNQAQVEYNQVSLEKYKVDAKALIIQSYYQVLLNKEQIELTQENIKNLSEIYKQGGNEFANGTLIQTDLTRYQLDLLNAQNQLQTAQRNYDNSIIYLKVQLAIEPGVNIVLTDALENLIPNTDNLIEQNDFNVEQRYEYKIEKSSLKINEFQVKKINRTYLPSVYLYGTAADQNLNNKLTAFSNQNWYPYNYFGIHADIPIFDGFGKYKNMTAYKLSSLQNQNNLKNLKYTLYYESINTKKLLKDAYDQYKNSKENYALAQNIMQLDQKRYQEGTITFAALKNTEYSLQNAQNNYINSVYNVLIAQVNYKKAKGEL
jgi:outer membrane protein